MPERQRWLAGRGWTVGVAGRHTFGATSGWCVRCILLMPWQLRSGSCFLGHIKDTDIKPHSPFSFVLQEKQCNSNTRNTSHSHHFHSCYNRNIASATLTPFSSVLHRNTAMVTQATQATFTIFIRVTQ